MKSNISHIYFYVSNLKKSYEFYKKLFAYFEYKEEVNEDWGFAFGKDGMSFWFEQTPKEHLKEGYHRKRTGLNHIAIKVNSKEDVDSFSQEFLQKENVPALYDTPKSFPEYGESYYAVYFEDPDRIKLEVAFHN